MANEEHLSLFESGIQPPRGLPLFLAQHHRGLKKSRVASAWVLAIFVAWPFLPWLPLLRWLNRKAELDHPVGYESGYKHTKEVLGFFAMCLVATYWVLLVVVGPRAVLWAIVLPLISATAVITLGLWLCSFVGRRGVNGLVEYEKAESARQAHIQMEQWRVAELLHRVLAWEAEGFLGVMTK